MPGLTQLHLDAEAKAELHSEAIKLIAWHDRDAREAVKAPLVANASLEREVGLMGSCRELCGYPGEAQT